MKFKLVEDFKSNNNSNEIIVYNGISEPDFDYSQIDLSKSEELGLHCGTELCARARGYKYINKLIISNANICRATGNCPDWSKLEVIRVLPMLFNDKEFSEIRHKIVKNNYENNKKILNSTIMRNAILNKGINVISYENNTEDPGSLSYIILDKKVIKKEN